MKKIKMKMIRMINKVGITVDNVAQNIQIGRICININKMKLNV